MKNIYSLLIVSIGLCFVTGVAFGSHGHYHANGIEKHMSFHYGGATIAKADLASCASPAAIFDIPADTRIENLYGDDAKTIRMRQYEARYLKRLTSLINDLTARMPLHINPGNSTCVA